MNAKRRYPNRIRSFASLCTAAALVGLVSCGAPTDPLAAGSERAKADSDDQLAAYTQSLDELIDEASDQLPFSLEDAPRNPGGQRPAPFSFCSQPDGQESLSLTNAAWLMYFAGNEYASIEALAPAMLELGFGDDGDLFWIECARDLQRLRAKEAAGEIPQQLTINDFVDPMLETWGRCSREWFTSDTTSSGESLYQAYVAEVGEARKQRPEGLAAMFEAWLVKRANVANYLQFFDGGTFTVREQDGIERATFERGSTQVMWARHRDRPLVVVAFRGTEPSQLSDVIVDLKFWMSRLEAVPWGSNWGKVHAGFLQAYLSVEHEMLLAKLAELEGAGVDIWLTGHSLGGALATVFASRILAEIENGADYHLKGLYTFGSPRLGDPAFEARFTQWAAIQNVGVMRFRNQKDVVTTVPLPIGGYKHVGRLVHLGDSDLAFDRSGWFVPSASDHYKENYYGKLQALLTDPSYAGLDRCQTWY